MRAFIWGNIPHLTAGFHGDGGIVVIAETEAEARVAIPHFDYDVDSQDEVPPCPDGPDHLGCFYERSQAPDHIFELAGDYEPGVIVFPDAGCC